MSCLKLDTVDTDSKWISWKEKMQDKDEWILVSDKKNRICYECSTMISLNTSSWTNRFSYEIITEDKVVSNYYCEECYLKWIRG